ncbi:MAG: RecQ family ATP-dependent DNA helicase, partial [Bacteroidota bacterium]
MPAQAQALGLLQQALKTPSAQFRPGQWEAIDQIVNRKGRLLVVERTGWGKSSVYFISTRLLRQQGMGLTIIISPLLALMRNQLEAAQRFGLHAETVNSTNTDDWPLIQQQVVQDQVDVLFIPPERLGNDKFMTEVLLPIADRVRLFVVDEAHCISDWGHDFRVDYRRIVNILRQLPRNLPVLGTTATANDRVIQDIQSQLGDFQVQRGSLDRSSLHLQTIVLPDQPARLAWLAQTLPQLPGTGIVYVLTKRDANQVARWLQHRGIDDLPYYSGITHENFDTSDTYRVHLEEKLLTNDLKALIATTALSMGYDKPDLAFVIHYQMPGSVVGYYQQVGRAGRGIAKAYGVLLAGKEDEDIHEFFRRSAFPPQPRIDDILQTLAQADQGLSVPQLEKRLNYKRGQIDHALKYMSVESPSPVVKHKSKWLRTPVPYQLDRDKIRYLTQQRYQEWQQVVAYVQHQGCLMAYLQQQLDDPNPAPCRRCANCQGNSFLATVIDQGIGQQAASFIKHDDIPLKPRKQLPPEARPYGLPAKLKTFVAEEGRILSRWRDAGWGTLVAEDKARGHFSDQLVVALAEMIEKRWKPDPIPRWVTCVPSRNHPNLVPDFAQRLAQKLHLPFKPLIK